MEKTEINVYWQMICFNLSSPTFVVSIKQVLYVQDLLFLWSLLVIFGFLYLKKLSLSYLTIFTFQINQPADFQIGIQAKALYQFLFGLIYHRNKPVFHNADLILMVLSYLVVILVDLGQFLFLTVAKSPEVVHSFLSLQVEIFHESSHQFVRRAIQLGELDLEEGYSYGSHFKLISGNQHQIFKPPLLNLKKNIIESPSKDILQPIDELRIPSQLIINILLPQLSLVGFILSQQMYFRQQMFGFDMICRWKTVEYCVKFKLFVFVVEGGGDVDFGS